MSVEALNCPNCGAPLPNTPPNGPWLCIYCSSLVHPTQTATPNTDLGSVSESASQAEAIQLDEAELNAVKELLISGQREEAVQRYQALAGVDAGTANQTVERMAADFTAQTVLNLRLSPYGVTLLLVCAILLVASLVAWLVGRINPWIALGLIAFSVWELAVFGRAALNTLRYMGAPTAPAEVLHFIRIGDFKRGRTHVHAYRFILSVRPPDAPPFQASVVFPVRDTNVSLLHRGETFQVKYLPGKPESVMFDRLLKTDPA